MGILNPADVRNVSAQRTSGAGVLDIYEQKTIKRWQKSG